MLQTLIVIASIVVLSGAILTSTLVTAKNAFHHVVTAKTQNAMTDATSQFQFWAAKFVAKYGTEADWDAPSAQQAPMFESLCDATVVKCSFGATMQWRVTGATMGLTPAAGSGSTTSTATNMTPAVDEQRISATISVIVTDSTGRTTYGGRTQEVTARVLNVSPYVVVTGTHDLGSDAGAVKLGEGDTGGVMLAGLAAVTTPSPSRPAEFTDTIVHATIECANTTPLFDQTNPESARDNGSAYFDKSYRPGGALVWAYQMPCTPTTGVPSAPSGVTNYSPPVGSTYEIYASDSNLTWQKGDDSSNSFPR